ncbi:MAG: hypothetical protein ACPGN6_04335 [Gammaproteobacteria bacterium]
MSKLTMMLVGLFVLVVTGVNAETETACERVDGAIKIYEIGENPVKDTDGNSGDACKELPDNYKINIFRFGLCKTSPYNATNNLDSCSFLVNSDTGVSHEIAYPAKADVTTNSKMAIGSYDHMVLVLENKLGIKHTEEFDTAIFGATGSGKKCWTIASTTAFAGQRSGVLQASPSTPAMDCGDTPAPAYSYEIFDSMGEGGESPVFKAEDDGGFEMGSGTMRAKLLKSDLTTATNFEDAARILVAIQLESSKSISEATTGFEIRFKMTDSVSVDLSYDGGSDRLYAVKNGADPFQIDLIVK